MFRAVTWAYERWLQALHRGSTGWNVNSLLSRIRLVEGGDLDTCASDDILPRDIIASLAGESGKEPQAEHHQLGGWGNKGRRQHPQQQAPVQEPKSNAETSNLWPSMGTEIQ